MKTYSFTFVISPPIGMTQEEAADKLYGAGCDDALLSVCNSVWQLDFDRVAFSRAEAIASASRNIKDARIGSLVLKVVKHKELVSILEHISNRLRHWLLAKVDDLVAITKVRESEQAKPEMVRQVEEIIRDQAFGCYTEKVAELCSRLTGHRIDPRPPKPKPCPRGAFLVWTAPEGQGLSSPKTGETIFCVNGVHGFGTNTFGDLGMKTDGTVGGCLDDSRTRPATACEIRKFISEASVRALLVLAEIVEGPTAGGGW